MEQNETYKQIIKPLFRGNAVVAKTKLFYSQELVCHCQKVSCEIFPGLLPPATKLGQGYVFTGVCDSVNRGGVTSHPPEQTPQSRHPPGAHNPPGADTNPPGAETTPPEQTPTPSEHAVRYGQRAGGTHPTGMQSCLNMLRCDRSVALLDQIGFSEVIDICGSKRATRDILPSRFHFFYFHAVFGG